MPASPNDRLKQLIDGPEDELDLAEAALLIAQHEYPQLDVDAYLRRLDGFADTVRERLQTHVLPEQIITAMNYFLYKEQGFAGNTVDYYDPRNSFLNEVLDRRLGIPITLSILYIEVGRRLGLNLQGVSFPGHFLVKLDTAGSMVVLDPYASGVSLSAEDLEQRLTQLFGDSERKMSLNDALAGADKKEIVLRVLRNLKAIYLHMRDHTRALSAVDRMLLVAPDQAQELRDRGFIYQELECTHAALADLRRYLTLEPEASDAEAIHARVVELQQQAAMLH